MKLVTNRKTIKISSVTGGVKSTLRRALGRAHSEGWTKVIITGQGKKYRGTCYSTMTDIEALGILRRAQSHIIGDFSDD